MELELSRAHRRFLGLTGHWRNLSDEEAEDVHSVSISAGAVYALQNLVAAAGHYRSGPLFGRCWKGLLSIEFAAADGYGIREPLAANADYLLGWVDALRAAQSQRPQVDWIGHWLMFPDAQMKAPELHAPWVGQARDTGLLDARHCLLVVGWRDGELAGQVYFSDVVLPLISSEVRLEESGRGTFAEKVSKEK